MCFYSPNLLFCELSMSRKGDFTYFSHKKASLMGHLLHSISTSRASGFRDVKVIIFKFSCRFITTS